jgi:hypothetical protein
VTVAIQSIVRSNDTISCTARGLRLRHEVGPREVEPVELVDLERAEKLWSWDASTTRLVRLSISLNRPQTTIRVSCRGAGCPFHVRTEVVRRRQIDLARWFEGAAMRTGARIQVLLLKSGFVGQSLEFRTLHEAVPRMTQRCVPQGSRQPARRCG